MKLRIALKVLHRQATEGGRVGSGLGLHGSGWTRWLYPQRTYEKAKSIMHRYFKRIYPPNKP